MWLSTLLTLFFDSHVISSLLLFTVHPSSSGLVRTISPNPISPTFLVPIRVKLRKMCCCFFVVNKHDITVSTMQFYIGRLVCPERPMMYSAKLIRFSSNLRFTSVILLSLQVTSTPWNDDELAGETSLITQQLAHINRHGDLERENHGWNLLQGTVKALSLSGGSQRETIIFPHHGILKGYSYWYCCWLVHVPPSSGGKTIISLVQKEVMERS